MVDPVAGIDALRDVRLTSVVTEIGERLQSRDGEEVFDATGAVVAPGFIDMHVHLREPGEPHKETIESGTEAAVRGGFTAVACMPNTSPALDDAATIAALLQEVRRRARCRVYPVAAITRERRGVQPCDFGALAAAGAVAFSDDGDDVADAGVLYDAALAACDIRGPFITHCETAALKRRNPRLAETLSVARDVLVARETRKAWHIAHVSTAESVEVVRHARESKTAVSAEATPHHLLCSAESAQAAGAAASVNPPLRTEEDASALRRAVVDGTIEVLASDHAPHTEAEKRAGAAGFSGLEIAVGAYALAFPQMDLARFVCLVSCNPARILGVTGGTLQPGSPADVTVFRDEPWRVDAARFASRGRVTPFDGMTLPRRAVATIVAGEARYRG